MKPETTPAETAPRKSRKGLVWLGIAALLLAVVAFGFLRREAPVTPVAETDKPPVTMQLLQTELHRVTVAPLRDTIQITGSLAPSRALSIPAEVAGRMDTVAYRVGDPVAEGDVLATVDVGQLRNRLEQQRATAEATQAQLTLARAQLDRARDLVQRGVSTMSSLESESANVAQLEANHTALLRQVETAELDLSKARITAPFAGVIAERSVDPGTYVNVGTALLRLVDITALDLEGGVPAIHTARLRPDQRVDLTVDGIADHRFEGRIERIAPVAVTGTRVLPVFARIGNESGLLKGGMFASGTLVLEESPDAIGIPADALREDEGGSRSVLKVVDGRAVRQPVTVARLWNRDRIAEISEGLSPGDTIVALKLERLQDGMAVSVVEP